MRILIVSDHMLPAETYGGTQRVVWSLARALTTAGHHVRLLARAGSTVPFAEVIPWQPEVDLHAQIPEDVDIVHVHGEPDGLERVEAPWLTTIHGNRDDHRPFPQNAVFISRAHAARYGSLVWVHNGLAWDDLPAPDLRTPRDDTVHFLGKVTWREKNARGALDVLRRLDGPTTLDVLGGTRFQLKMGVSAVFDRRIRFHGMVDDAAKARHLSKSRALLLPVRWHEPFGLAVIESLYFGCPVLATPYGSLPELLSPETGHLSNHATELARVLDEVVFDPRACHERARDLFNADRMASGYVALYERVLNGHDLNPVAPMLQALQRDRLLPWNTD